MANPLPPFIVLAGISTRMRFIDVMSTELLSPELEFEPQDSEEEDGLVKNMQQEIECPRCSDVMTLSSDFDKLLYFCQECELSLLLK
jgi:hypothetical protein